MEEKHSAIAHTSDDGRTQPLYDHLVATAKRAAEFASSFGCSEWAYLAGLWHDLGKYSPEFQRYILSSLDTDAHLEGKKAGHVKHSTAGAVLAVERFQLAGRILAYIIAGHHAGLPDFESDVSPGAALSYRLTENQSLGAALTGNIPKEIIGQSMPQERPKTGSDPALWIRMLYSCVVDADFLDTESFVEPDKRKIRGNYSALEELVPPFSTYMQEKEGKAPESEVNCIRADVYKRCCHVASVQSGIYSLTVPTGGGKTLSSMAFALNHAVKFDKRRIIYVIPYTSIIEQTADQFREIFGDAVIEHHSNLDVSDPTKENLRSRLACENWDAPIVVTTSVQFFESLFSSRSSRCRKLHNIIDSVVVMDEVQLVPPEYLNPILHALNELSETYGVTLLLSTATQPAFAPQPSLHFNGLPGCKEIIEDPLSLHNKLKRVDLNIMDLSMAIPWEELSQQLQDFPSVLCIVNRRDDCRMLWKLMPQGTIHLSALMCGAHRAKLIAEIKDRLKGGIPTRVISTQLVEAGVDLDFPVVYRALAGLDSIAQAAGRCNREGNISRGKMVIFSPPSDIPVGHLRQAAQITKRLLEQEGDLLSPDNFIKYFEEFYWIQGQRLDKHRIQTLLNMDSEFRCSFREAAQKMRLIDESAQAPVIVKYEKGSQLIQMLEKQKPDRALYRQLQRYVVNIPIKQHLLLLQSGAIKEIHPDLYIQINLNLYNDEIGFCAEQGDIFTPDDLII